MIHLYGFFANLQKNYCVKLHCQNIMRFTYVIRSKSWHYRSKSGSRLGLYTHRLLIECFQWKPKLDFHSKKKNAVIADNIHYLTRLISHFVWNGIKERHMWYRIESNCVESNLKRLLSVSKYTFALNDLEYLQNRFFSCRTEFDFLPNKKK